VIHQSLAQQQQLLVPAFTSILDLSARSLRTTELGQLAGVTWLVECRLSQEGDRWQIEASLVDVRTDESEPVLSLAVEASKMVSALESVVLALHGKLGLVQTVNDREGLTERYTEHMRSFDAYLQGEQAMRRASASDYRQAREYFRAAQDVPGFELARVREADAFMRLLEAEPPATDRTLKASLSAVSLMLDAVEVENPVLAELYVARMRLEILSARLGAGEPPDEIRQRGWFERAVELKPSYAEPYRMLAGILFEAGEDDEARDLLEQAHILDPAH